MAYQPLQNYLRTFRRRSGLSQAELAMLLGTVSGAKVSRYENFSRIPSAATIFAYEVIFGQPVQDLFTGTYSAVGSSVRARARKLLNRLSKEQPADRRTARKLVLLRAIIESKSNSERRS